MADKAVGPTTAAVPVSLVALSFGMTVNSPELGLRAYYPAEFPESLSKTLAEVVLNGDPQVR